MRLFGLIGKPLTHSFSQQFFTEKFARENIKDCRYELFQLEDAGELKELIVDQKELVGLNVTIPYKEAVIPLMDHMDETASQVGAVNVIRIDETGRKTGFNSDLYGFRESLRNWLPPEPKPKALVLGTGGASKAIRKGLEQLGISYQTVSRTNEKGTFTYTDLLNGPVLEEFQLIINTTPLGTFPEVSQAPALNYDLLNPSHYLYDLVYNPEESLFLQMGRERGAQTKNGLEMLILQAEKSWEIWNT